MFFFRPKEQDPPPTSAPQLPQQRKLLKLTLEVNSTRDPTDGLSGTSEVNVAPDGFHIGGWGGLGGHVWIESRSNFWLKDPFVRSRLAPVPVVHEVEEQSRTISSVAGRFLQSRVPGAQEHEQDDFFSRGFLELSAELRSVELLDGAGSWSDAGASGEDAGRDPVRGEPRPEFWVRIYLEIGAGGHPGDAGGGDEVDEAIEVGRARGRCSREEEEGSGDLRRTGDENGAEIRCRATLEIERPKLYAPWSPENQYVARFLLVDPDAGDLVDVVRTKFGFKHLEKRICRLDVGGAASRREVEVLDTINTHSTARTSPKNIKIPSFSKSSEETPQKPASSTRTSSARPSRLPHPPEWGCFFLNNHPLFLHGYGDDSVFPHSLAPPLDYSYYKERTQRMKGLGFNYVRHHSAFLPVEYFSAACDTGLFLEPEHHIAYLGLQGPDICGPDDDDPINPPHEDYPRHVAHNEDYPQDMMLMTSSHSIRDEDLLRRTKLHGSAPARRASPHPALHEACDAMLLRNWKAAIKKVRNFPCVFSYTLNNEWPFTRKWEEFAAVSYDLDPDRWFNIDDGVFPQLYGGYGKENGSQPGVPEAVNASFPSYAYWAPEFSDAVSMPLVNANAYRHPRQPPVRYPLIAHEMGNVVSFPSIAESVAKFKKTPIKAFWLTDSLKKAQSEHGGKMARLFPTWTAFSNRKYLLDWKLRIEALRKATELSGYEWWLGISDYWQGSNGIYDHFGASKFSEKQLQEAIKPLHADIMLLLSEVGDNLPSSLKQDGAFLRAYESGGRLKTSIWWSNRGRFPRAYEGEGVLRWRLEGVTQEEGADGERLLRGREGGETPPRRTVVGQRILICQGEAVPGLNKTINSASLKTASIIFPQKLSDVSCKLPDLGTFVQQPQAPLQLELHAEFSSSASPEDDLVHGRSSSRGSSTRNYPPAPPPTKIVATNLWRSRLYAKYEDGPVSRFNGAAKIFTLAKFCSYLPFTDLVCSDDPVGAGFCAGGNVVRNVFVTDKLEAVGADAEVLRCLAGKRNNVVVLIASDAGQNSGPFFERFTARFKTQWWMGSGGDRNMGSFLDTSDKFWTEIFTNLFEEGLVDDSWHRLVEGGSVFVMDAFAQRMWPDAVVRTIDR